MSDEDRIRIEDGDGVRRVTLTRAEKKNAFDVAQAIAVGDAIDAASRDDAVRAIVVTAEGDYFSAGADVRLFLEMKERDPAELHRVAHLFEPLRACAKPLIAMVQGHCVGMGVTVLPHFDLVYAADHVTFKTPFVSLGLVLEYGSAWTLPRLIGIQRAKELVLRAAPLDAATAAEWGLVTRVFAPDALEAETMAIAREIAAHPPGGVAASKRLLDRAMEMAFDATAAAEDAELADRYGSPENVAAVKALMSKKR